MGSFIADLLKQEPTPLEEVRRSLKDLSERGASFIYMLTKHHDYLEESISVIMDKESTQEEKQFNLDRFFRLVEMHGKAEEETLYAELRYHTDPEVRLEGYSGQDEHDLAFQLEAELLDMNYRMQWSDEIAAKAKVAVSLVRNHIKEEEDVMFPLAEKFIDEGRLETLSFDYVEKCQTYLAESEATSRSHPVKRQPVVENFMAPFF